MNATSLSLMSIIRGTKRTLFARETGRGPRGEEGKYNLETLFLLDLSILVLADVH
jgi:hypothetical protein